MYFTVIIPAYKDIEGIKNAIRSIYEQEYPFFEILICADGEDGEVKELVESYKDSRIKYYFVEHQGNACLALNEMTKIATGSVILHLDQDNTIYRNCFLRVLEEWNKEVGIVIYRINHQIGVIPKDERIEHRNIDMLNGITRTDIAQRIEFKMQVPSADSAYYKDVEKICKNEGHKIVFIKDILGVHN